jgi:hypothetical protein
MALMVCRLNPFSQFGLRDIENSALNADRVFHGLLF